MTYRQQIQIWPMAMQPEARYLVFNGEKETLNTAHLTT